MVLVIIPTLQMKKLRSYLFKVELGHEQGHELGHESGSVIFKSVYLTPCHTVSQVCSDPDYPSPFKLPPLVSGRLFLWPGLLL